MALQKSDLELFPEEYLLEEDEMGESEAQSYIIDYLVAVLKWLFRFDACYIPDNLELYHRAVSNSQHKITPDISLFKNARMTPQEKHKLTSWNIDRRRVAPSVVFEVSSNSTWQSDVMPGENNKPVIYGRLGIKEYFAYDPNDPPVWRNTGGRRLLGWRYEDGQAIEIEPDEQGRLWSEELDSWLKEDGWLLRLYDRDNNLRLTESEAKDLALQAKDLDIQARNQRIAELERLLRESRGENNLP